MIYAKLPRVQGERLVIWSDDGKSDGGDPQRAVLTCSGGAGGQLTWTLGLETAMERIEPGDEDEVDAESLPDGDQLYLWDEGGSLTPSQLGELMREMTLLLAPEHRSSAPRMQLIPSAGPPPCLTQRGKSVLAELGGRRVWLEHRGDHCMGHPMLDIETTKPLTCAQWIAAMGNLARAVDAYDEDRDGWF